MTVDGPATAQDYESVARLFWHLSNGDGDLLTTREQYALGWSLRRVLVAARLSDPVYDETAEAMAEERATLAAALSTEEKPGE